MLHSLLCNGANGSNGKRFELYLSATCNSYSVCVCVVCVFMYVYIFMCGSRISLPSVHINERVFFLSVRTAVIILLMCSSSPYNCLLHSKLARTFTRRMRNNYNPTLTQAFYPSTSPLSTPYNIRLLSPQLPQPS